MNLVREGTIFETKGADESELYDIPFTGHLSTLIEKAFNELRDGNMETTKELIKYAEGRFEDSTTGEVLAGNEVFNGMDKKFLNLIAFSARRIHQVNNHQLNIGGVLIHQNPVNTMIARFLSLYEGGHFAEGGGFSEKCDDGDRYGDFKLDSLTKIVEVMNLQDRDRSRRTIPGLTISQKLNGENDNSDVGDDVIELRNGKCIFKEVYDECNGNLDAMRTRFNRFTPKTFSVKITPEMSKQREAKKAAYASLGGNGNTPNPTSSLGGI